MFDIPPDRKNKNHSQGWLVSLVIGDYLAGFGSTCESARATTNGTIYVQQKLVAGSRSTIRAQWYWLRFSKGRLAG